MNERINELFGQALDEAVPETWTTLNPAQLSRLKEKFAELIVRECAAEAHRRVCIEGNDNMIYAHLLEHFGVEQ